jgi:general L-amino acid transport system substrate-binding protein
MPLVRKNKMRGLKALICGALFSLTVTSQLFAQTAPQTAISVASAAPKALADRIPLIRERGKLICGVNGQQLGFSAPGKNGILQGLDVDFCRSVAAALLRDPDALTLVPLDGAKRFPALKNGEVDILARNTTATLARDTELGLEFGPIIYYDGQAILARTDMKISSVLELKDAKVCFLKGSSSIGTLETYFKQHDIPYEAIIVDTHKDMVAALNEKRCNSASNDASYLAGLRLALPIASEFAVLPEFLSREPLAPAVADGQTGLSAVVRWVIFAMFEAEQMGITRNNVDDMRVKGNADMKRFLGASPGVGKGLGLDDEWAYRVIKTAGNYGEIYNRHLGRETALDIPRFLNRPWNRGGLLYAIPFR